MSFIGYLVLGSVLYVAGFVLNRQLLEPKRKQGVQFDWSHPLIMGLLAGCFAVMLVLSVLLGRFVLEHMDIDWLFVLINSLVATFVFYFGLNPEQTQMDVPR